METLFANKVLSSFDDDANFWRNANFFLQMMIVMLYI